MSLKIFLLLVLIAVSLYCVNAKWEGKKCIPKRTYNDGCNNCQCTGNRKNSKGVWVPIIGCTKKVCLNPDGTVKKPRPPPADFWEK